MVSLVFSAPRSLVAILSLMHIVMTIPEAAFWVWASSEGYSSCPLWFLPLKGGVVIYLSYLHYISYLLSTYQYQSVNLFVCLSVCRSVGRSIYIYNIYIYICKCCHLFVLFALYILSIIYLPISESVCLFVCLQVGRSVHIYIYIYQSIYPYIYIHTWPSVSWSPLPPDRVMVLTCKLYIYIHM